jgi:Transposase DDE domain
VNSRTFHEIWIEQCDAAQEIKLRYGPKATSDYIVAEKMLNFADAAAGDSEGPAERLAALEMVQKVADRPSLRDHAWHRSGVRCRRFVVELRTLNVGPHVAPNTSGRRSAIDKWTTRPGYGKNQRVRKRIEEAFGWIKTVAGLRKTKLRRLAKVDRAFPFTAAAYNIVRIPKLVGAA